ncbi:MAG: ankyrin repeat domain-containing protein [Candidatus Omnitrophica bacterium]|nr:ankyrin repeat domain-containing protein [Candidatus Omnitrophota bacterium]
MKSPNTQIRVRDKSLYVLLCETCGVLRIDGINKFRNLEVGSSERQTQPLQTQTWKQIADINSDLIEAARVGDTVKVKQLLKQGADVNAKDKDGWTALIEAAAKGHTDTVKALIDAGADVNAKDKYGETAPMNAATGGRGRYDTSTLSEWQRLLCAVYFSSEALIAIKNGDEVGARYFNEQAEKVSSGQMIELEFKFPALPQPPEPEKAESKMAGYVDLLGKMQKDIKTLQDIEIKIKQTEVKKKQAESKKAKAEKMIAESRALDTAKPEDKTKAKSLKDQAQRLLQEAQNEIELANKAREELFKEQAKIQNELKEMQENAGIK